MEQRPGKEKLDPHLARRLHAALTAGEESLFRILRDTSAEVLRAALKNPRLGEEHLLVFLRRRDLPEDLLKAVHDLERVKASRRLKAALAKNPGTPGAVVRSLLSHLFLFELVDLCFAPGVTPDQKLAAELAIIQRLPSLELGNKITLARRGTSLVVGELLKEGDGCLMEPCLGNPRLKEVSVLQFLNGPRACAQTISAVARHSRWKHRPNLRQAMLKNPKTPPVWFTLFLPGMKTQDLHNLLASRRLAPGQKHLVKAELVKRGHGGP